MVKTTITNKERTFWMKKLILELHLKGVGRKEIDTFKEWYNIGLGYAIEVRKEPNDNLLNVIRREQKSDEWVEYHLIASFPFEELYFNLDWIPDGKGLELASVEINEVKVCFAVDVNGNLWFLYRPNAEIKLPFANPEIAKQIAQNIVDGLIISDTLQNDSSKKN
jgi:hypothetical protein